MAGVKDVVISAQALDGVWDVLGANSARGVFPENVVLEADAWGPSRASFNLRRDPARPWPDIGAFTPIEIEVGGTLVWDGRVQETPSQIAERVINVQCEGWQYHLDDDVYERVYVHNDLTAWKDQRAFLAANLVINSAAGKVQNDNGVITLGWAGGDTIVSNQGVAVTLDLGPSSSARRVVIPWDRTGGQADTLAFVVAHDTADWNVLNENLVASFALNGATSGTFTGTTASPRRYVTVLVYYNGPGGAFAADVTLRLRSALVFADAAYESGNASILKASDVALDALTRATVLLSTDRSGMQATSLNIPTFAPSEPLTARQAWERVDAYHDWVKQIAVGRRPIYKPKPSTPIIEVGVWSAATDEDASANSGEDIYNRTVIAGQTPAGQPARVKRAATGAFSDPATPQLTNPSFATNLTGWTVRHDGSIVRDTGVFDTTPASMRVTTGTTTEEGGDTTSWTTPLELGGVYQIVARIRREAAATAFVCFLDTYLFDTLLPADLPAGQFATYRSSAFFPTLGSPLAPKLTMAFNGPAATLLGYIDSIVLYYTKPTLPDRRGFRRTKILPVSNALPPDNVAANVIADTWLSGHKTTPFKGSSTMVGNGAARDILTGEDIPPERLLLKTMELIRFNDRADPDTGGHGRDGRIVGVSYSAATDTAQVTIDNSRASFEALMARLDLLGS
jgi:hypothetical protein